MTVTIPPRTATMRAIVREYYGAPEALSLREVERPAPASGEVLVRVHAASVNPVDWHRLTGTPYLVRLQDGLRRPKSSGLGVDFAGTVEAVAEDVTALASGDEVLGARTGALADYVCVRADRAVVPKPSALGFEQAAAVPVAGLTALEGLRVHGSLRPGQSVLVNGASGGVGTFAVQIAKALGASHVAGVCSTRNTELVRSLGADEVVDYTCADFTRSGRRYDVVLDAVGNRSWRELRRILAPQGTLVMVGGPKTNRLLGPLGHTALVRLASMRGSQRAAFFLAGTERSDLGDLAELLESGAVTPVIDRTYDLAEAADAFCYLAEGHARGKVVVRVADATG